MFDYFIIVRIFLYFLVFLKQQPLQVFISKLPKFVKILVHVLLYFHQKGKILINYSNINEVLVANYMDYKLNTLYK